VESNLLSKYLMYKYVYGHRSVRVAPAMIKKAVLLGLRDGMIRCEELYRLDDEEFFSRFSQKGGPFHLVRNVADRVLYKKVFDSAYDPERHSGLLPLQARLDAERRICERLRSEAGVMAEEDEVIIDIPEPVSFEIDLKVILKDRIVRYPEAGSVFDASVVKGFTRALRFTRIVASPRVATAASEKGFRWDD